MMKMCFLVAMVALVQMSLGFSPIGAHMVHRAAPPSLMGKAKHLVQSKLLRMAVTDAPPSLNR